MELHLGKQHKPQAFPAVCPADTFSLEDHQLLLFECGIDFLHRPFCLLLLLQEKSKGSEGPGLMMDKRILLCVSLGWQI